MAEFVSNPGIREAMKAIESAAKYGKDYTTQWAVDFLGLLIPADHPAYDPFCAVRARHDRLWESTDSEKCPTGFPLLRGPLTMLEKEFTYQPLWIQEIRTKNELLAFRDRMKLRSSWHEPDEVNVSTVTTPGTFDNCSSGLYYLEQSVLFLDTTNRDVPVVVASANLATLCSWATEARSV